MSWRIANSLEVLQKQLNELFPNRSKVSDGGIGDERHQASSSSDHNPHVKDSRGVGVVTARDFTFDDNPSDGVGIDCQKLADCLDRHKDPRIKYLIWNRQICSSLIQPWVWRPYNGANAHKHHLHLSVDPNQKLYDSTAEWNLSDLTSAAVPKPSPSEEKSTAPALTHPNTEQPPTVHTVVSGDTLSELAEKYNTKVETLKQLNKLKGDGIWIGQHLKLK